MSVLKPCPFCGSERQKVKSSGRWGWFVSCECAAVGPSAGSREGAIEKWNNRKTCHDLSGTGANGEQVFHCSECGCVMSLYDLDGANVLCTNHVFDYPRYCPNCGAKVVA